jgi:hypothetical protein
MHSRVFLQACDRQQLNPLDLAMRTVDRVIRELGYPGFETQKIVWLTGRVDINRLRRAMGRLASRHPVIAGRLVEDLGGNFNSYWQFGPDTPVKVKEIDLSTDEPSEVFACAESVFSVPCDLTFSPPLRFFVLHRPSGQDALLFQYSHVLTDHNGARELVRELDRLYRDDSPSSVEQDLRDCTEQVNMVRQRLKRTPARERRSAALRAVEVQRLALRGEVAVLGKSAKPTASNTKLKIAARELTALETSEMIAATRRICGLQSLSMTILASVFRVMNALDCAERNRGRNYVAGIGLDMRLGRNQPLRLQNMLSVVPIFARHGELASQPALIRTLSQQMRDRLESKADLGVLSLVAFYQRRPKHIRMVLEHLLRRSLSLWYAYFGAADLSSGRLFELKVESIQYVGPTWVPMGISLVANQFQGRLLVQATYDPELVSTDLAGQFLDQLIGDLRALSGDMAGHVT